MLGLKLSFFQIANARIMRGRRLWERKLVLEYGTLTLGEDHVSTQPLSPGGYQHE
jgi:hypothetical protein